MALVHAGPATRHRRGWGTRPTATTGWASWLTTVDHKRIGVLYGVTAFVFLLIGGLEALLIRVQLAAPTCRWWTWKPTISSSPCMPPR